jgi:hypothetical protein
VKILFLVRHYAYLRLFESSIAALAERGHQVHLAAHREEAMGGRKLAEDIAARYTGVHAWHCTGAHGRCVPEARAASSGLASTICATSIRGTTRRRT